MVRPPVWSIIYTPKLTSTTFGKTGLVVSGLCRFILLILYACICVYYFSSISRIVRLAWFRSLKQNLSSVSEPRLRHYSFTQGLGFLDLHRRPMFTVSDADREIPTSGQRIMPEIGYYLLTRGLGFLDRHQRSIFTEFPALFVDPRVGISRSASETDA